VPKGESKYNMLKLQAYSPASATYWPWQLYNFCIQQTGKRFIFAVMSNKYYVYRKNMHCISREPGRCLEHEVNKEYVIFASYMLRLRLCLFGDYSVFFHKGLKICPLHTHILGRPGDIPIISFEGMNQKISFHLFYGFCPDFFLESL
jgi:hypothetical protein